MENKLNKIFGMALDVKMLLFSLILMGVGGVVGSSLKMDPKIVDERESMGSKYVCRIWKISPVRLWNLAPNYYVFEINYKEGFRTIVEGTVFIDGTDSSQLAPTKIFWNDDRRVTVEVGNKYRLIGEIDAKTSMQSWSFENK